MDSAFGSFLRVWGMYMLLEMTRREVAERVIQALKNAGFTAVGIQFRQSAKNDDCICSFGVTEIPSWDFVIALGVVSADGVTDLECLVRKQLDGLHYTIATDVVVFANHRDNHKSMSAPIFLDLLYYNSDRFCEPVISMVQDAKNTG